MYFATEKPLPQALRCSECPVCYEELSSSDKTSPIVLNCGHIFCITCIRLIRDNNRISVMITCPLCRRPTRVRKSGLIGKNIDDTTTRLKYLGYILLFLSFLVLIYFILPSEVAKITTESKLEEFLQNIILDMYDTVRMVLKIMFTFILLTIIHSSLIRTMSYIKTLLNVPDNSFYPF